MIYVNIDDLQPSEDWLKRADQLTQSLIAATSYEAKRDIIKKNEIMWAELKDSFSKYLSRKCWYSESVNDFAHCHMDHFRPKLKALDENGLDQGGYWWLAFDWRNYRYSAPAGNTRKKDYFHVNNNKANTNTDAIEGENIRFLDPTNPLDPFKIKFNNEGYVSPKIDDSNSGDYIQAEYTIRKLNLNMEGLVEGRRDVYRRVSNLIRQIENLLNLETKKKDPTRAQVIKVMTCELIKLSNKFSPYSAAAKYCLREYGQQWALDIVSIS